VQRVMTAYAGVLRNGPNLERATVALEELADRTTDRPCTEAWEATNLHTVASLIAASARRREETRGSHWRSDFPDASDDWRGHLVITLDGETLTTTFRRTA
jgi:L-aspartate oxidase